MKTQKKRRRERKTDYKARLNLLKSSLPRVIVRKTNKYVIVQYVKSERAQDKVIVGMTSKELLKYSWEQEKRGSLKSLPACYFIGLLLGKKIKAIEKNKGTEAILDVGLARSIKRGRIYAVLKGILDSGIKIKHAKEKEIFPENKRLRGEHLKNKIDFERIKENILKEK